MCEYMVFQNLFKGYNMSKNVSFEEFELAKRKKFHKYQYKWFT